MDFLSQITQLGVPLVTTVRSVAVSAPLTGGGDLSANRTIGLSFDASLQVAGGSLGVSALVASSAALTAHAGRTDNPHAVTAAQAGALPLAGGTLSGRIIAMGSMPGSLAVAVGSQGALEIRGDGTGAAFMTFHRPTSYAAYFGLDTDSKWKVGGWSMGANSYEILHANNFGSYTLNRNGDTMNGSLSIEPPTTGVLTGLTVKGGDITAYRSTGTTGVIYLGASGSKYVYYDGTSYRMPGGELYTGVSNSLVLHAGNYMNYAPTKAGVGASGTWGIDISGSAGDLNGTYYADAWLRVVGSTAQVKLYGGAKTMNFRTDGVTNPVTVQGNYAFVWTYGGDAAANRKMMLQSDGTLWTSAYGWLDTISISGTAGGLSGVPAITVAGINSTGESYFNNGGSGRFHFRVDGAEKMVLYWDTAVANFYSIAVGANVMTIRNDTGRVGIRKDGPAYVLEVGYDSAGKPGSSAWSVVSDMRTKDVASIRPFTKGLASLRAMPQPVYYRYNGLDGLPTDQEYVGHVAQVLQAVEPEMVRVNAAGLLSNNYHNLQFITTNAVVELDRVVQTLTRRIDVLEDREEGLRD